MRLVSITTTFAILVLTTTGCEDKGGPKEAATGAVSAPTSTARDHAPAGAKPGSHEDWCRGHKVPESMCTRCNSSLIPAFKATGDWCKEHGLPESQCLICNPDLKIERPPKTAGK